MDFIAQYSKDQDKVTDGVWVNLPGGARIRVAYYNNAAYGVALLEWSEKLGISGDPTPEETKELTLRALAAAILLDWEGITVTVDGEPQTVPYSQENAYQFLQFPEFAEKVAMESRRLSNFRSSRIEEEATALGNVLSGLSAMETGSPAENGSSSKSG